MGKLSAYYKQFQEQHTDLYPILVDKEKNAKKMEKKYARGRFPIYYDREKEVAKALNQQKKLLKLGRLPGLLIVDKQGIIQYAYYSDNMHDIPEVPDTLDFVKEMEQD